MTKPLPNFETWGPAWQKNGWNNFFLHAAEALEYLAKCDRPTGGEQSYNAIDLEWTADYIRRSLDAIAAYKERIKG